MTVENNPMEDYFGALATTLVRIDQKEIRDAVEVLHEARRKKASVWIVGNGGSAATASHFSNDLIKMAGMRAFSVPDLYAAMLAYGNDDGWDEMFAGAVDTLMLENDVLVAISCGGRSKNVVNTARLFTPNARIVLTGSNPLSPLAQLPAKSRVLVPHDDIRIQEDVHLAVCHMIAGELAHGK